VAAACQDTDAFHRGTSLGVDVLPVADPQYNHSVSFEIEDDPVIADPVPIRAELGSRERVRTTSAIKGVLEPNRPMLAVILPRLLDGSDVGRRSQSLQVLEVV